MSAAPTSRRPLRARAGARVGETLGLRSAAVVAMAAAIAVLAPATAASASTDSGPDRGWRGSYATVQDPGTPLPTDGPSVASGVGPGFAPEAAAGRPSIAADWSGSTDLALDEAIRLSGTVSQPGEDSQDDAVRLDRFAAGAWRPVLTRPIAPDGTWAMRITPPPVPGPVRYRVAWLRDGRALASGELATLRLFRVNTYAVRTHGTVRADVEEFARLAAQTYADGRGWARAYQRFEQVDRDADFTLYLAQASRMGDFSSTCDVRYSCRVGKNVVINETPWLKKTPSFKGDLRTYRHMVVNHETGHWLGLGHRGCSSRGALAPVMMQQSKGLGGCRANAWPLPAELAAAGR